jgi:preprotein translocase subunit SecE
MNIINKINDYLQDTYNELVHKVSWPTWADLQGSSIVVMVASLIIATVVFGMDFSFQKVFEFFYEHIVNI